MVQPPLLNTTNINIQSQEVAGKKYVKKSVLTYKTLITLLLNDMLHNF